MIKKILEIAPKWTVASFLLLTQMQVQAEWTSPNSFSSRIENGCSDSFWGEFDYLYWKIQNSPEHVPLVIQGPTLAVPQPVLGSPGTTVVLGGKKIDTDWRSGGRVALGYWFDNCHNYGAEVGYFILPSESKRHSVSSDGTPNSPFLLAPFFDVLIDAEDSSAISSPLIQFEGTAVLKLANEMQGAELNFSTTLPSSFCGSKFTGLAGVRYWNFREQLTFSTNSPFIPTRVVDTYKTKDEFNTENNFYGAQLGLVWEYDYDCLSITAKGKVALGAMREELKINGHLLTNYYNNFEAVKEYAGGYFALPTNIGKHSKTSFAAIPEFNFDIGYELFDCLQVNLGYTFLYASNVLWAGKQIDRNINPLQATTYTGALVPVFEGPESPKARLKKESLWVQGLNVGVEFNF